MDFNARKKKKDDKGGLFFLLLLGAGAVLYGVLGLVLGYMTLDEAKNYIWAGLTAMAVKGAISKVV